MSSIDEDRSLTSGIPIPQWMRSKTENYGFDPSTLSPPTHEGEFFYFKYQKPQASQPAEPLNLTSLNEVIQLKERAFVKHTDPCKQFIPIIQDTIQVQKPKVTKPMGVDDGFKGEGAACGASVVEVAHQMLTGRSRGLTRVETEGSLAPPPPPQYLKNRRNSRSLPASPVTSPGSSPRTKRKLSPKTSQSRLFGLSFRSGENSLRGSQENIVEDDDGQDRKTGSSWILTSFFAANESKGAGNEVVSATVPVSGKLVQRESKTQGQTGQEPVSTGVAVDALVSTVPPPAKNSFFKSKPYLRDLNLLTPTSM